MGIKSGVKQYSRLS